MLTAREFGPIVELGLTGKVKSSSGSLKKLSRNWSIRASKMAITGANIASIIEERREARLPAFLSNNMFEQAGCRGIGWVHGSVKNIVSLIDQTKV